MTVQRISAVTLAVREMPRSVDFYQSKVGLELLHGGAGASFTTFRLGDGYLNLTLVPEGGWSWWGRVILYVNDVEAMHRRLVEAGSTPTTAPQDAPWGERYFHVTDPDGHELSFARPLRGRS